MQSRHQKDKKHNTTQLKEKTIKNIFYIPACLPACHKKAEPKTSLKEQCLLLSRSVSRLSSCLYNNPQREAAMRLAAKHQKIKYS